MKIFFCPFLCVVFTSLVCPLEAKEAIVSQALPKTMPFPAARQKQFTGQTESGIEKNISSDTLKSPYVDEIPLGFVEYELESGKMNYNGQAFSSKERPLLRQKCRTILEK